MVSRFIGWWRMLWGHCPACNDDAPECDNCKICAVPRRREARFGFSWASRTSGAKAEMKRLWESRMERDKCQ